MTEIQTNLQSESQKLTNNKDIIAYLAEKFPLCFSVEGEAKPLKVGLFQDLAEALKDDERVSKTQLRHALRQYLHGCRLGVERVDLQGNPTGALEQEHVDHAQQQLAEAKAKFAEKRAAEKAASPKPTKKRPMRKPADKADKMARKSAKSKTTERQPKVELKALDVASLQKGKQVKVKVGDSAKSAVILEIVKESARVELDNGLVLTVTADRLFA